MNSNIDTSYVRKMTKKIREFIKDSELEKLRDSNRTKYTLLMQNKYKDFYMKYPTLFRLIINGDNLSYLNRMLTMIDRIKDNKISKGQAEKEMGNELFGKYVKPKIDPNKLNNK